MEIWKDIENYEGLYQVSNLGRIKSLPHIVKTHRASFISKEKLCKLATEHNGYLMKYLSKYGKKKYFSVHRLVAKAFIPNPTGLPFVNHKNENKSDNRVENLEWCDAKYNTNFGTGIERRAKKQTNKHGAKPVIQIDMNDNEIQVFQSFSEIGRVLGLNIRNICRCCMGYQKTAYGYKWKYKESHEE